MSRYIIEVMYLEKPELIIWNGVTVQKVAVLIFCQFIYIFLWLFLGSYIKWEWFIPLSSGGSWEHKIFIFQ